MDEKTLKLLKALKVLKESQDKIIEDFDSFKIDLEKNTKEDIEKIFLDNKELFDKYTLEGNEWFCNGEPTGIKAEGPTGPQGPEGKQGPKGDPGKDGKNGKDGKPGKDGKNGKDGKPGKDGKNGKDGKPGKDGVDGETPTIKIGKIKESEENGGASAKLRRGKDGVLYLDLILPRGPQGFMGFDAKINGKNTVDIEGGNGIRLEQKGKKLIITADIPDVNTSKFIIKEYATYDDLPKPIISYSYSTSFDYQWGPPEDYYNYVNGEWVTDVAGVYLSIENPQYLYTPEDLANVTCKITSELPTDLYPDITEDSFSLNMGYSEITPSYISANYYPVLTTSYGDYEHNPWTLGLNLSFDIILPPKLNSEVAEDVIYKVLDTNKCYILDTDTNEWIEFEESVLNLIPVMNFIDRIKQDKLVAGQNIATINNESLLNGGNLDLVTSSSLGSYLLKTYVRTSRSTSTSGYTYDVRYINNMVKTSRNTSSYNTYGCTYINGLIKTSETSSDDYTYSCNYIDNNFLTLDTLPKWDGGNE